MNTIRGRILIVEDDLLVALNYKDCLEQQGFSCTAVQSIRAASKELKTGNYQLMICDHDLPDGKGLTLIKKHKANDLSVIYVTAATRRILNEARAIPAIKTVLAKPVELNNLTSEANGLLRNQPINFTRLIGIEERRLIFEAAASCKS